MGAAVGGKIRIGVGGWDFAPWRGTFYPAGLAHKRELEYSSRRLTSIEINSTFYGAQKPESFARWRDETPDDFVFAAKAPRFATVRRTLAESGPSIERFFAGGVMELKAKLGPINWQFAPTKVFDAADFEAFLALLPKIVDGRELRHAVEPRHGSFRSAVFVALARRYGVAIVTSADSPYPMIADVAAPFVYLRVMGTQPKHKLGYSAAALARWAERARVWADGAAPEDLPRLAGPPAKAKGRDVFLYVIGGEKALNPATATALIARVGKGAA